jgi:transcriptional regulator with XRE-family HTH domain
MNKLISEWLERKYLEYQMHHGRISLRKFSKILEISPGYLSQLMNGTNSKFSYDVARKICEVVDDWELFDLLNYKKPPEADQIPNNFKTRLEKATSETNRVLKERNLTGDMPEAEQVTIEIFERYGFKYTDTQID